MNIERAAQQPSRLHVVPLRDDTVDVIADAIGVEAQLAPFQLPGGKVYQLTVPGNSGRAAALVTIWPSLRRVDVTGNGCAVVFTRVESAQLVAGVEVLFRRDTGEFLVVAVGGRTIVRS